MVVYTAVIGVVICRYTVLADLRRLCSGFVKWVLCWDLGDCNGDPFQDCWRAHAWVALWGCYIAPTLSVLKVSSIYWYLWPGMISYT